MKTSRYDLRHALMGYHCPLTSGVRFHFFLKISQSVQVMLLGARNVMIWSVCDETRHLLQEICFFFEILHFFALFNISMNDLDIKGLWIMIPLSHLPDSCIITCFRAMSHSLTPALCFDIFMNCWFHRFESSNDRKKHIYLYFLLSSLMFSACVNIFNDIITMIESNMWFYHKRMTPLVHSHFGMYDFHLLEWDSDILWE